MRNPQTTTVVVVSILTSFLGINDETHGFVPESSKRIRPRRIRSPSTYSDTQQESSSTPWPRGPIDPATTIAKAAFVRISEPETKQFISPPSWDILGNMAIVTFQHRTLDIDADDNVEILNT